MCVCMCICTVYICVYIYMYTYINTHNICRKYIQYIWMGIGISMHSLYIHINTYMCVCKYIHAYTCMYLHTLCTYTAAFSQKCTQAITLQGLQRLCFCVSRTNAASSKSRSAPRSKGECRHKVRIQRSETRWEIIKKQSKMEEKRASFWNVPIWMLTDGIFYENKPLFCTVSQCSSAF